LQQNYEVWPEVALGDIQSKAETDGVC